MTYRATQYGQNEAAGRPQRVIDFEATGYGEARRIAQRRLASAAVVGIKAKR